MPKLSVWLCLVAVLLQGGLAGRGLVLCVEPGGAMNLEASLSGERCGDCPANAPLGGPVEDRASQAPETCACVDIAFEDCPDRMRPGQDPIQRLECASVTALVTPIDALRDLLQVQGFASRRVASGAAWAPLALTLGVVLRV